jgi:hypothetical protein
MIADVFTLSGFTSDVNAFVAEANAFVAEAVRPS